MKTYFTFIFLTLVQCLAIAATDPQNEYEEVSYDDLVNQLHQKKTSVIQNANDPLDANILHAGFGLITSANSLNIRGDNTIKYQNGFQLSLGIDLFSPQWVAEAALRNFGQAHSGTESRTLREFDLKLIHRDRLSADVGYRLGAGIGNRYLKLIDDTNGVAIEDNTPTSIFFAGFDFFASKNMSVGVELGLRTSMVNSTTDRNAADLMIRLDTYF